jgi:hypothetical protein
LAPEAEAERVRRTVLYLLSVAGKCDHTGVSGGSEAPNTIQYARA